MTRKCCHKSSPHENVLMAHPFRPSPLSAKPERTRRSRPNARTVHSPSKSGITTSPTWLNNGAPVPEGSPTAGIRNAVPYHGDVIDNGIEWA